MTIGERVRAIRKQHGMTQRAVAAAAGMLPQYLSDLERGRIGNPSLDTLRSIASVFAMGVDELIGRGLPYLEADLPGGLCQLLKDRQWAREITAEWVDALLRIEYAGRRLETKREFLEAYLALKRILDRS